MSHINVTINGRQYRMACEEGQEARLLRLAESLESRIENLRGKFGEIGDARLTVMARSRRNSPNCATSGSLPPTGRGRPRPRSPMRSIPPPTASKRPPRS